VTDRFLPDKAVAVLDLAGSRARRAGGAEVGEPEIARVVAKMAGIPESRLLASDRERILGLEQALAAHPTRDLDAVARRELRDARVVVEGHDARHDGHRDAQLAHLLDEVEVRVRVEEELRDRPVRAGLDLRGEVLQVALRVALLRVVLGIGGDFDGPVPPLRGADELDQLAGVAELAASKPSAAMSLTVDSVFSRVEPPAP